ncbi:hypothetical protein [Tropicibacter oceani]|uniref:Uncharacterized protein n=1 Tax=Tropicibacter oceani TaxID=3058420 RepID=A0ABY8QN97_9RHOB|nr:hypothetical protein [Tropicibacter oceani]WGW06054.1 hypothetical protein QF118_19785 [Tropicibacter oceani]
MKTLYLHIGRGKTGTTAQQKALADARPALLRAGLDYILAGDMGRGHGHQEFAKSFITLPPAVMVPAKAPEAIRAQTAQQICDSPAPAVLLSSENFPLADIDALRDWIAALPVKVAVRVILFARSQDELAESEYNQLVKLKRETRSAADYAAALEGADFFAEAEAWAARFGRENILCRVYDGAAQDAVARLGDCLPGGDALAGVSGAPALTEAAAYANRSLGARALLTARMLNTVELEDRLALYRQLFRAFEGNDIPAVLFSSAEARAIRARFAASNARFARAYLGRNSDDLGGRRYDDAARDRHYEAVRALNIAP